MWSVVWWELLHATEAENVPALSNSTSTDRFLDLLWRELANVRDSRDRSKIRAIVGQVTGSHAVSHDAVNEFSIARQRGLVSL